MIMETVTKDIRCYGKHVIGCEKHNRDVMISYCGNSEIIHDVFLTQEQAKKLSKELLEIIQRNDKDK